MWSRPVRDGAGMCRSKKANAGIGFGEKRWTQPPHGPFNRRLSQRRRAADARSDRAARCGPVRRPTSFHFTRHAQSARASKRGNTTSRSCRTFSHDRISRGGKPGACRRFARLRQPAAPTCSSATRFFSVKHFVATRLIGSPETAAR